MKELRNNVDTEVVFTKLEDANEWYLPKENFYEIFDTINNEIVVI